MFIATQVDINGVQVPVFGRNAELAIDSHQFKDWVSSVDPNFKIRKIYFQSVDFVQRGENFLVRFIKFYADVFDELGNLLPGIVFIRESFVAILVVLECEGEDYTLLTVQPRLPSGSFAFPEIPTGTLEEGGNFVGGVAQELREETGIEIKIGDLIDLTSVYKNRFKGVYSTVGASGEYFQIFALRKEVTREYLNNLQGKCTGLSNDGEMITLRVINLRDLPVETPDAKALSAMMLYNTAKALWKI